MLNRRNFMKVSAVGAAGLMVPGLAACGELTRTVSPIGLGLYTMRHAMAKSVAKTLHDVAAAGCTEVEFAGYYGHSPKEINKILADTGLTAPSTHARIEGFEYDFDRMVEQSVMMGHKYIILSWLPEKDRTLERYKQIIEKLNVNGEKAKAAGLQVAYHNHAFEFDNVDGHVPYEMLLTQTDKDLVQFQIDLYWFGVAKQDPVAIIDRYPGRFPAFHVKDMDKQGNIVDVGDGIIDFARAFKHADKAGVKHFFIEHDNSKDPLATVRKSYKNLSSMTY